MGGREWDNIQARITCDRDPDLRFLLKLYCLRLCGKACLSHVSRINSFEFLKQLNIWYNKVKITFVNNFIYYFRSVLLEVVFRLSFWWLIFIQLAFQLFKPIISNYSLRLRIQLKFDIIKKFKILLKFAFE